MAQVKEEDDMGVFKALDLPKQGERVWCKELSYFLHIAEFVVKRIARRRLCLKHIRLTAAGKKIYWVTPHTAAMVILQVRALQEAGSKKTDWHKAADSRHRENPMTGFRVPKRPLL